MVLTVTEDTPADMLAGSMELLVQMPRDHHVQTQRVTVQRSTPMMDLLVQIATAHKLTASSYSLQAIGERGLVLPHQPNTPIGALDALQVKLLPKQASLLPRKSRQANQPFETTFRLQVHLPRNQLYVSRVSPKTILAEILEQVCREKNLDRNKYELRHPANLTETLDLSLTLHDYHLQEVTLYPRQQSRPLMGSALSSQDIMALQKQEECRRQQARHTVFGFIFKKSKESSHSLSTDSLGTRSVSPARSDETQRSSSPVVVNPQHQQPAVAQAMPSRPHRKRRPAPKPPTDQQQQQQQQSRDEKQQEQQSRDEEQPNGASSNDQDKIVISHSRNSSDSSGYHEASVLSDNPDNSGVQPRMPETLPRRSRMQGILENAPRKLAHTSHTSKSLGNLAIASTQGLATLSRGISNSSLNSAGQRKKRAAPPPPIARPLPSSISTQGLERIVDSDESLTSDMELSKPSSDIDVGLGPVTSSKANSDIACHPVHTIIEQPEHGGAFDSESNAALEPARVVNKEVAVPVPKPRKVIGSGSSSIGVEASRASLASSESSSTALESASFGLPSLTEDEREEIALAIDSIVEAARAYEVDDDDTDDVFADEHQQQRIPSIVQEVPEAFEDDRQSREQTVAVARSCAVISTIPKCDHLAPLDNQQFEKRKSADEADNSENDNGHEHNDRDDEKKTPKKRSRVARSQSEMSHFEFGSTEKHARHLTSNGETFTFALNPNLGKAATRRIEASVVASSGKAAPMETDVLLQKVSDTLSHSLSPPSPPPTPESANVQAPNFTAPIHLGNEADEHKSTPLADKIETTLDTPRTSCDLEESTSTADKQEPERSPLSSSSDDANNGNATLGSVGSSDYVSSTGEEIAIPDWEYHHQIPAPPSAFRDDNQPTDSSEAFSHDAPAQRSKPKPSSRETVVESESPTKSCSSEPTVDVVDAAVVSPKPSKLIATQLSCDDKEELKKAQVINELETKIQSQKPIVEPAIPKDEVYAPKIAPVENNLSNFTITTYSRKKSLDIFESMEEQQQSYNETRILTTFATLTRGKSLASNFNEDNDYKPSALKSAQSMDRVTIPLVEDQANFVTARTDALREKPVHRSKSYIVLSSNEKFQNRLNQTDQSKDQTYQKTIDESPKLDSSAVPKKFTSTTSLVSSEQQDLKESHKRKFSQWRDNILERHKEPSRETQLQSLQVLKSILPQLHKAQTADDKSYKNTNEDSTTRSPAQYRFEERDSSTTVASKLSSEVQLRPKSRVQEPAKRYTYCGPPAVSFGSWSERPSLNVQIKTDTDYKFGGKNSDSAVKTIVSLSGNGAANSDDGCAQKEREKNEESCVDTSSVNFKELAKAFGQSDVRLRPKSFVTSRNPQQRYSEYLERPKLESTSTKLNGNSNDESFANSTTLGNVPNRNRNNAPVPPAKRFTSVIGISNNNNASGKSHNASKANAKFANGQAMTPTTLPVDASGAREKESVVPKPPTMPIITGVTLKSVNSRPKSGPPTTQADPRDLLLESIRNFGRDKLKSVG